MRIQRYSFQNKLSRSFCSPCFGPMRLVCVVAIFIRLISASWSPSLLPAYCIAASDECCLKVEQFDCDHFTETVCYSGS